MRFLRPATDADRDDLEGFSCADPDRHFEIEVEDFVRGALGWCSGPDGYGREVLVLEDEEDLVGATMHEDDEGDRFVNAVAVRSDRQGEGLGTEILGSLLADLSSQFPDRTATWLVHPANFASHAMSQRLGAEPSSPPEDKPYTRYAISL